MMTGKELANKALEISLQYKTLYVNGTFGWLLNKPMKERCKKKPYLSEDRKRMIDNATEDTFAFDCCGLVKGIIWGWDGKKDYPYYGGATYTSAELSDINELGLIQSCKDVSDDFCNIQTGELVYMNGHCGIYIGDNHCVECSPAWKNGVQVTSIVKEEGYNTRTWEKHGKLPQIDYEYKKSNEVIAREVIAGLWGNNPYRKALLEAEGYDYRAIQDLVNELCKKDELEVGEKVRIKPHCKTYDGKKYFANWVYTSDLYVREINGDCITVSTLKVGAITGRVHKDDIVRK